jgi:hypothetical protein
MRLALAGKLGIAALLLAGCGVEQLPVAVRPSLRIAQDAARAQPAGSWMAAGAKKLDLLYVSDYESNDVYAYSYPGGKLSGVLKGVLKNFVLPAGLCTDAAGDVFIPDSADSTVLEYGHGSTKLQRSLLDPYELPYSCAVDPVSGDLAVVDFESASGAGGVSIYSDARGRAKTYRYGFLYKYYFDTYDDKGDLFVDATIDVPSEPFAFAELARGSKSLQPITLNHGFGSAGGVDWDGTYVAVDDSTTSTIYRFAVTGSAGTKVGSTRLDESRYLKQFFVHAGGVVGASFHNGLAMFWKYPAGGVPTKKIGGLREPFGLALSKANR